MSAFMWIFNILSNFMWFSVLNASFRYRYNRWAVYLTELVCFIIGNSIGILFPFLSPLRFVFAGLIFLVMAFLIYKEPWQKVLLYYALVMLAAVFNEILCTALFFNPQVTGNLSFSGGQESYLFLLYLVLGAIIFFLLYLLLNTRRLNLKLSHCLLFAGFPLSQMVLIHAWIQLIVKFSLEIRLTYFLSVSGICLLADLALIWAIFYTSQRDALMKENKELERLISAQDGYYKSLSAQYDSVRRMRHDIDNQLLAMNSLISRGETQQAGEYLRNLMDERANSGLYCRNLTVDSFLQQKVSDAKAAGAELKLQISMGSSLPVSNIDLIRALGNLIDNALEAVSGLEDREISLSCRESQGYLLLSCDNPVSHEKKQKRQRIPGLERGLGTAVLNSLAEKYQGRYSTHEEPGHFEAKLILKLQEVESSERSHM